MKKYNNYFAKKRINLGEEAPLEYPLGLYVGIASHCNFKCAFCPHSLKEKRILGKFMEEDLYTKIIREVEQWNCVVPKFDIGGLGEALLHPNIKKFIEMAGAIKTKNGKNGIRRITMISNGSYITKDIAKTIKKNVDSIIFSIEGMDDEEYLKYAGTKISFQTVLENIKILSDCDGDCEVNVKIHNKSCDTDEKEERFHMIFDDIADIVNVERLIDIWPGFSSSLIDSNDNIFRYSLDGIGFEKK